MCYNKFMENKKSNGMEPGRLVALSDGIFAFSMTLLVISINLPPVTDNFNIGNYIIDQWPNFWNFAVSFLLLAFFWVNFSQQINHIGKTSRGLILINIIMLLFVVLIPFSTSLFNDYPKNITACLLFNLNMLCAISIQTIFWFYAVKNNLVSAENKEHIEEISKNIIYLPLIPFLALIIGLMVPKWSNLIYLVIPFLLFFPRSKN